MDRKKSPESSSATTPSEAAKKDGGEMKNEIRKYREAIFEICEKTGWASLAHIGKLSEDREFILKAVRKNWRAFKYASPALQADPKIKEKMRSGMLAKMPQHSIEIPDGLQNEREVVIAAIKKGGLSLKSVSEEMKGNKEAVLAAVTQDGFELKFASEALRADQEVVMKAVKKSGCSVLFFVPKEFVEDREFMLHAVKRGYGKVTYDKVDSGYLSLDEYYGIRRNLTSRNIPFDSKLSKYKEDREMMLEAFKKGMFSLSRVSEKLKSDKEVVMAALKSKVGSLRNASTELKNEKMIVLMAIQNDGAELEFASETLKGEKEVVMAAVQKKGGNLKFASEALRADREVVMAAVRKKGGGLQFASMELRADREVVMAAVQKKGGNLKFASEALRADREVVMAAMIRNRQASQFAPEKLRQDPEIQALNSSGGIVNLNRHKHN